YERTTTRDPNSPLFKNRKMFFMDAVAHYTNPQNDRSFTHYLAPRIVVPFDVRESVKTQIFTHIGASKPTYGMTPTMVKRFHSSTRQPATQTRDMSPEPRRSKK
ncbi:unnamed protein product, partial [Ectocarpus sp. 4 AP-2014]